MKISITAQDHAACLSFWKIITDTNIYWMSIPISFEYRYSYRIESPIMTQHHIYANCCLFELAVDRQCDAASSPTLVALLSRASLKSERNYAFSHTRRSAPLTHPRLHGDAFIDYRACFYLSCACHCRTMSAIAIRRPPAEREKIIIPISCSISVGGEMIQL